METHPRRGNNLGNNHFVLVGTRMFEPRVTALEVTPWKCSSRGSQGWSFSTVFMLTHLSSKHPLSCAEQVVLQGCCSSRCPAIPSQATPGEHCLWGGISTRVGSPTESVVWGL